MMQNCKTAIGLSVPDDAALQDSCCVTELCDVVCSRRRSNATRRQQLGVTELYDVVCLLQRLQQYKTTTTVSLNFHVCLLQRLQQYKTTTIVSLNVAVSVCLFQRLQQCKTRTAALNTVMSLFEEQLALLAVESSTSLTRPGTGPQNPHDQR